MFERIGRGIGMPINSFGYISEKNLWGYMVLPLLVTAVLVAVLSFLLWVYVLGVVSNALSFDVSHWPWIFKILFSAFAFIVKILVFYLLFSFIMRIYLSLFDIIVIPFLSPLVEKILNKEGITTITIKNSELFGYILSTIWYSVKMLIWQSFIALLLLFTGPLQPFLNFGFASYFLGRSYFDTVFDLLGKPKEFGAMIKGFKSEAFGLGFFSSVFVFIPILGAIFAPILCVVAATRLYAEKYNKPA